MNRQWHGKCFHVVRQWRNWTTYKKQSICNLRVGPKTGSNQPAASNLTQWVCWATSRCHFRWSQEDASTSWLHGPKILVWVIGVFRTHPKMQVYSRCLLDCQLILLPQGEPHWWGTPGTTRLSLSGILVSWYVLPPIRCWKSDCTICTWNSQWNSFWNSVSAFSLHFSWRCSPRKRWLRVPCHCCFRKTTYYQRQQAIESYSTLLVHRNRDRGN